jgi:AraC-like DNA-binding protein
VRDVALSLGVDIGPQLAALELGLDDIAPTSNKYLPANKVTQLLERCAKLCNAPDFGLRVGEAQDISVLGPIALAIVHAPSGRSAFEAARRNLHLLSLAWRLEVRDHAEAETESFIALRSLAGRRPQSAERMLVFIHRVLGWVTAQGYAPRAVWLQHQPISPLSRYRSAFGVTPLFGMPELGIAVANSQLDATDPTRNERLFEIANNFLEREFPAPDDDLVGQVRIYCERALIAGECTQLTVAGMLGLHERTLQRRLQAHDQTFEQIKDSARKDLALRYLARRDMTLSDVSNVLGYAEPSAFSRSCKRWFGVAPSAVRRQLVDQAAA